MKQNRINYKPDLETKTTVIEVKHHLSAVRTLRDSMVKLAMILDEKTNKQGYLVAVDPRISVESLCFQMDAFKALMQPDIAHRLKLVVMKHGQSVGLPPDFAELEPRVIDQILSETPTGENKLPNAYKREEVFLTIIHRWVTGQGPMTARHLEETVGCNYRTVSSAVEMLGPAIERQSDRRLSLKYFPERDWKRFLAIAQEVRSTVCYADASDQPRSPESLLRRLEQLSRRDVSIGGVPGAKHYFPGLDIVGIPRIDLCVYAPGRKVELDFVSRIDPALEQTCDPTRPVRLAVHFVRRKKVMFENDGSVMPWADPLECLIELYLAHLDHQALGFQDYLVEQGRSLNGR